MRKLDDKTVLIKQLKQIAAKLTEEVKRMPEEPLTVYYDNGGGQSGFRENPYFTAYEKLLASYTKTLTALKSMSSGNEPEIVSLDALRSKFKIAK